MIPILLLLFLCQQVSTTVSKAPTRRLELPVLDAIKLRLELRRIDRTRPFKMRWNQRKVQTEGGGLKIYTPWYLRRRTACAVAGIVALMVLVQVLGQHHLIPFVAGMTAWVDGNTKAAPTADNMDGGGTDLASGDTVSLATKSLIIDKSVGSGSITITAGTFTSNASCVLTMDAGGDILVGGASSISGSVIPSATSVFQFDGANTINNGGTLGVNVAWTWIQTNTFVLAVGGAVYAPNGAGEFKFGNAGACLMDINGDYHHDNGKLNVISGVGSIHPGGAVFYDILTVSCYYDENITIEHNLTINGPNYWEAQGVCTVTMGTTSAAATIVMNSGYIDFKITGGVTFQSASVSYKCVVTSSGNTGFQWAGTNAVANLKWLDIQYNLTTDYGGHYAGALNITGDCNLQNFTISATHTFTCTTSAAVTLNLAASKTFSNGSTFTMGAGTVISGGSATTTVLANTGTWTWSSCTFSKVDIQFTITTPGTGKTIALNNVTVDGVSVVALDTITFSDYCVSSAGFAVAANANLQVNLNGHVIFVSNSTCSGTLIVYGSLLLDNSATVNTPGAHSGTITGTGAIQGVGTSVPYLYFTNMAVGAHIDCINAVLVFDTSGASVAVGRNTVATDIITILAASTKTNLSALFDNAIEYGTRTFPEFFASQYKAGVFVGISRAPLDVDGMSGDFQDALIGIEFQVYVMGHSPSKDQKLAVDLAEEIEAELLADNHKALVNGGTIITFSEFIKGPPVAHGDVTLHFVLLEAQYRKSTTI
jgi:hypothetical protein